MKKSNKKNLKEKGFALILALGVLSVLFIVVVTLSVMAATSTNQNSYHTTYISLSIWADAYAGELLAGIKKGTAPEGNLETKLIKPQVSFEGTLENSSEKNSFYNPKGITYKPGDKILKLTTGTEACNGVSITSVYILNPERTQKILLSEKMNSRTENSK